MKLGAAATPILLIVLTIGSGIYAYLVDRGTISDSERAARRKDVFPSFRAEDVTRLELDHGQESLVLERDADAGPTAMWLMTSPRRERADAAAVDSLVRELELAARVREVQATADLGLETPRMHGAVTVGRLRYRFSLGADAARPAGGAYLRVEDEGTFVVDRAVKVQLLRGADAYRDRTIVGLHANEISRIDVHGSDGNAYALERNGNTFRVAGARLRASRAAAEHILSALDEARVESFLDPKGADLLGTSVLTVTIAPRDAGQARVELRLGGACPGQPDDVVLLRTSPSLMQGCTAKALADALATTPESLVDKSAYSFHADEIEQIRIESVAGGGPVVELARKASGWHERAPDDRELDADEVDSANELALELANARGAEARHTGPNERMAARTRASLVRTGGGSTEVVELGAAAADGTVLARRTDDDAVLRLAASVAHRFEPHPVALRARSLWRPPFDAVAVVALDNTCAPVRERVELHDRTWIMLAPKGFAADPRSIADLAETIARAKVDAWVAEHDDGSFGFDRPGSCIVTLALDGSSADAATRRLTIAFGAEENGQVYGHTGSDPAVFVAPKTLRDLASHPAVDRSHMRLEPNMQATVTLVRGTARLVVEQTAGGVLRTRGRHVDAHEEDDKLGAALAAFHAEVTVHVGPPTRDEGMDRPTLEIRTRGTATDTGPWETRITIGATGHVDALDVYFARASGVDATFAVSRQVVNAILDAW